MAASLILLLCAGLITSYSLDQSVQQHIDRWRLTSSVRQKAGIYLRDHFTSETLVALNPAGIIPYYSGLSTIDMLGLNNRHITRHGKRDRRLRFGHQAGDGDYVLSQEPDVIFFGGNLSSQPSRFISDREIWASPEFQARYTRVIWSGIAMAYIKNGGEHESAQP